jgi:hypothetical protein
MKKGLLIALIVFATLTTGCKTTVNQIVKNGGTVPLDIVINVEDGNGIRKAIHSIGEIPAGGETTKTFEVDNGDFFLLYASFGGAVVYKSPEVLVSGKVNPYKPAEIIAKPTCRNVDDELAFSTISKSFGDLGPDIGARPIGLKDALATKIGSLVVAIPFDADSARKGEILKVVTPEVLGVKVMTLDDVEFPSTLESQTVVISGSASLKANTSYGPIAHFELTLTNDSTYELKWMLKGFGQINKKEDPTKIPDDQINTLSENTKAQIKATLDDNPLAKIYYINSAYVVKDATMFFKEGKSGGIDSGLDAANFLTLKGVVTFKESKENNKSYGPVVLNYYGNEYKLILSRSLGLGDQEKEYTLAPTAKSAWFKTVVPR